MTLRLPAPTLLLAACAADPSGHLAAPKSSGEAEIVVDVSCTDLDCRTLFFDATASSAGAGGVASWTFTLPDGEVVEDAWAFYTPPAEAGEGTASLDLLLSLALDGGEVLEAHLPVHGFSPGEDLVYVRPGLRYRDGDVISCDLRLDIVGCLTGIAEVQVRRLPDGGTESTAVTSASDTVRSSTVRLAKGQSITWRVTKIDGEGQAEAKDFTVSCPPSSMTKTPAGG